MDKQLLNEKLISKINCPTIEIKSESIIWINFIM
jgi:hypothetical protein